MRTHFQRQDRIDAPLYVVTTLFNSARYRTRWKHWEDFAKAVDEQPNAVLYTVEIAFGERHHVIPDPPAGSRHRVIRLRTSHEIWLKENATNIGVAHVLADHPDCRYLAWVDADVRFARDDWADETVQRLQHYDVVQMWSQYQDLTHDHELIGTSPSFMANYVKGEHKKHPPKGHYPHDHPKRGYPGAPGLAWACTRRAWDLLGGLLDVTILGAGDWYMAHGFVGYDCVPSLHNHPRYLEDVRLWQERAALLNRNVGVVPGLAIHRFHGHKVSRKYGTREQILVRTQFDSRRHISRDGQGLLQFTGLCPPELRDAVRRYLHERNEDGF